MNLLPFDIDFVRKNDMSDCIELLQFVQDDLPGYYRQEFIKLLSKSIAAHAAICVRNHDRITGVLIFSYDHNGITLQVTHPLYRRWGVATMLLRGAIALLPHHSDIYAYSLHKDDRRGTSTRQFYLHSGFVAEDLVFENGDLYERLILRRHLKPILLNAQRPEFFPIPQERETALLS